MSVTILKYRSNFTPLHSKGSTVIKRGLYVGEGGGGLVEHMIGLLFLGKGDVAWGMGLRNAITIIIIIIIIIVIIIIIIIIIISMI